jgi:pyruvate formate-lyase/glycerol dehydratase family glycyl radical enzyme
MPQKRIERLKKAVQSASPGVCPERALLWTRYFRNRENRKKPPVIQMAEALRDVLLQKTIRIYPDELIVGNFSSKRVGGSIYPELHGLVVMQDLFKFSTRKNSPLQISREEIRQLIKIIPFWLFRFLGIKAHPSKIRTIRFIVDQLQARTYFINETGGVAHIAPDYEKLISIGTDGIISEVWKLQKGVPEKSDSWAFYEAVKIIAGGLAEFGERYVQWALEAAKTEKDSQRKQELLEIAGICRRVPRLPATTLQEALQSLFFAQIAINLESLDNGNSPGRMDFYLYPFYGKDLQRGILTREKAKELISAFSIKMSEIIPVFSRPITRFHGGMFNGQVVTVGGTDREGNDSSNELSYLFLEVMDELRMRQPNYHARVHKNAPKEYLDRVFEVLSNGGNSPALYNDDVIVKTMIKNGYSPEDARNYTAVGCVEPVSQGKSLSSTDAALFNLPGMLELALNEGKRFGSLIRTGQQTKPVAEMQSMEEVKQAFESQLGYGIERLLQDLQAVERANTLYHPTPFTSMLLDGCLQNGFCSTAGGARYNFSGIQCVGPTDTGDSLYAIEQAVFRERKFTLSELVDQLKKNLSDPGPAAYLGGLAKFGNDLKDVDHYTRYAVEAFSGLLAGRKNTRGGTYTTGLYSVTAHQYFGQVTGALPNGRKKGESFASGISPANGQDRQGPTALLNSVNRLDAGQCGNGINLNIKFGLETIKGKMGKQALQSLFRTYFKRGGMQVQLNVIDPSVLIAARDNPQTYPYLLIRVSGYSAYFNDLLPAMKDEIIQRTCTLL